MTKIQRLMKLHRLMSPAGEGGSNTGGTGTGEGTEGNAGEGGEGEKKEGEGEGEGTKAGEGDEGKKSGMSDGDAKLLKDVMKLKGQATTLAAELAAAKAALKDYDGLDPAKVRQLVAAEEEAKRKDAEARGEYDRLVAQMGERHKTEMAGANAQMSTISGENTVLKQQIADLTVGNAFGTSAFVSSELTLTPAKARVIYGSHFEFKDGKVVGYDKPAGASERTMLVDSSGSALGFDEAMRALIEADPDRDQLKRSKAKPGAGSSTTTKGNKAVTEAAAAAATSKLTGAEKIAAGLKALAKG